MTIRTAYANGTPSWIDLATTDTKAARAFYGAVFGWSFDENPTDQGSPYIMARKGDHAVAGMMQQPPEQAQMGIPPMWNTYVSVDDLAATVAAVPDAGGTVMMPPLEVQDAGSMAVIVDPTGAVVCLWQADRHIGAEVVNEHGALCWNEVATPDVAAAAAFYGKLFGWGTQTMDMGDSGGSSDGGSSDNGTYTVFTLGEDGIGGATGLPAPGVPAHWSTVFATDDCAATAAAVAEAGGTVMAGPFDTPVGQIAVCADPQGAAFQVIQMAEQADA